MPPIYRGDSFLIVRGASGARGSAAERPVFVFQVYLDDSATSDLPIVSLGGFLSTLGEWEALEPKLDEVLNRYSVPVFHAKQFNDTKPPFKDWSLIKKKSFANELFSVTRGHTLGVSFTVERKDFLRARNLDPKSFGRMSPITTCFSAIVTKLVTDPNMMGRIKKHGIAFLTESGNKNNKGIDEFFHRMSRHQTFEGSLRSISFVAKDSCRAIQIADFLAFYARRHTHKHNRTGRMLLLPACPYLDAIRRNGPVWIDGGNSQIQARLPQERNAR